MPRRFCCCPLFRTLLAGAVCLSTALTLPAAARDAEPVAPAASPEARELLAARVQRIARQLLSVPLDPEGRVPEYALTRARILLDAALTLDADDELGWRRRVELARLEGNDDDRRHALSRVVRLAPRDDRAQLELIQLRVADVSTIDGRLQRLERLLRADSARRLTPALRSRLASQAARLAREIQDQQRFARWLTEATRLDASNAEAAALLLEFARRRNAGELQQLAAAVGLIRAAPLRPAPRLDLAVALASHAVYEQAAAQFRVASDLTRPGLLPADAYRLWVLALGADGQSEDALSLLDALAGRLAADQQRQQQAEARGEADPDQADDGQPAQPDRSALLLSLDPQLLVLEAALADPGSNRRAQALEAVAAAIADAAGDDVDAAVEQLVRIAAPLGDRALSGLDPAPAQAVRERPLFRAFEAFRGGRFPETRQLIEPMRQAGDDPLAAYLHARLIDDTDGRGERLQAVVRSAPTSLAALLAGQRLSAANEPITPTAAGRALRELMLRHPVALWRMDLDASPWIDVRLNIADEAFDPFARIPASITLRNVSDMRLSFDAGAAMPTRSIITVTVNPGERSSQRLPPDVIDLDRRLTLEPDERIRFDFPLHRGSLGEVTRVAPFASWLFNASLLADPRTLADGRIVMGPLGDRDDVRGRLIRGVPASPDRLRQFADGLGGSADVAAMRNLAMLLAATDPQAGPTLDAPLRGELTAAIDDHLAAAGDAALAWALASLRSGNTAPGLQRLFDLAGRSDNTLVRCLLLERRVTGPDDPVLTAALRSDDPTLQAYSRAVRATIAARNAADADN